MMNLISQADLPPHKVNWNRHLYYQKDQNEIDYLALESRCFSLKVLQNLYWSDVAPHDPKEEADDRWRSWMFYYLEIQLMKKNLA